MAKNNVDSIVQYNNAPVMHCSNQIWQKQILLQFTLTKANMTCLKH